MTRTDPSDDFATFEPEEFQPTHQPLDRAAFAGVPPAEAARRLAEAHAQRGRLEPVTRDQKEMVAKIVLETIGVKGYDLANAGAQIMSRYREWLRQRVEAGKISESYAGHIAIQWNATVRCVFGEEASEELRFKGFKQHARKVVRRGPEDMAALIEAAHRIGYRTEDDKNAFLAYLELAWPTAGRSGSLLTEELTFAQVDWEKGTLRFAHVKNKDEHETVLSERAVAKLRERRAYCMTRPWWRGENTPILAGRTGNPLTNQAVNQMLKRAGVRAGFTSRLTTHGIRKSAGTIMARQNPRYAREQLGITPKVFEAHYNQPTVEDRLERRDLVPAVGAQAGPDELIGRAYLDLQAQRITNAQFQDVLERANKMRIVPEPKRALDENRGYL